MATETTCRWSEERACAGRTQTIDRWDSWAQTYDAGIEPWFHDLFRADGRPYAEGEVEVIRRLTQGR